MFWSCSSRTSNLYVFCAKIEACDFKGASTYQENSIAFPYGDDYQLSSCGLLLSVGQHIRTCSQTGISDTIDVGAHSLLISRPPYWDRYKLTWSRRQGIRGYGLGNWCLRLETGDCWLLAVGSWLETGDWGLGAGGWGGLGGICGEEGKNK